MPMLSSPSLHFLRWVGSATMRLEDIQLPQGTHLSSDERLDGLFRTSEYYT